MHPLDPTITVTGDIDPDNADGFPLLHPYLEQVWLPILGPSTILALRSIGRRLGTDLRPFRLELADLAAELGLGSGTGRNSIVCRTVGRAERFGHARILDPAHLEVVALVRPVPEPLRTRLPHTARIAHDAMTATREVTR